MKTILLRLPIAILLMLVLCCSSSVHGQFSEVGVRINRLNFDKVSNSIASDGNFNDLINTSSTINADFFLQQDKANHYVRYSAGFSLLKYKFETVRDINRTDPPSYITNDFFNLRVGYEIGKSWSIKERFRIQTGLASSFEKGVRKKIFDTSPTSINGGVDDGYTENTTAHGNGIMLSENMVLRADVKVCKQLSVGLEVQYGVQMFYLNSKYPSVYNTYDLNGNEISSSETSVHLKSFGIYRPRLSSPFLNLTYTFGKSN